MEGNYIRTDNSVKISVILVVFNARYYIRETINSVLNQTFGNFELLISDDGSTDGTVEILKAFESYSRINVTYLAHSGNVGKLRNDLIKNSRGEFIAFIDSDDIWFKDKLAIQLKLMSEYDVTCSNGNIIDFKGNILRDQWFNDVESDLDLDIIKLLRHNYVLTSSVLMRKDLFLKAGSFEDKLGFRGEDYILWLNICRYSTFRFLNKNLIQYRRHSENLSYLNNDERIALLINTAEIRRKYIDNTDKNIKKAARYGYVSVIIEISKLYKEIQMYSKSFVYMKEVLHYYPSRFSLKYLKYLLIYLFIGSLSLTKRGTTLKSY